MGNINLYYIRGISRTDTPVFSTLAEQYTFFTSYSNIYTIPDNSFYVPKFEDEIKIDARDLDFNSSYNYLSLDFLNKRYYYFIESLNYINEDVISLKIVLDVIQTYMFDIQFNNSEIIRKSIKRWRDVGSDHIIERKYIRENIGNDNFLNYSSELYDDDTYAFIIHIMPTATQKYWYQYVNTQPDLVSFTGSEKCLVKTPNGASYMEAGLYLILPFNKNLPVTSTYVSDTNSVTLTGPAWDMFRKMSERDYVLSISIISGKYLPSMGISFDSSNNTFTYDAQSTTRFIRISDGNNPVGAECAGFLAGGTVGFQELDIPEIVTQKTLFLFHRNTYPTNLFSWTYCPQLLDENFVQVLYGEPSYLTGYPLHSLYEDKLYIRTSVDLISNTRVYSCSQDNSSDIYLTIKYATSPQLITLYNNPYQSYLSRNQATLSAGRALALANNVYSGIQTGVKTGSVGMGAIDAVVGEVKYEAERAIKLSDLKFTPDTTKVNGNGCFDLLTGNIASRLILRTVSNLSECAEYFESFGYKTHEITTDNLFEIHNRYYYDYIKTGEMNFSLSILTDNETIDKIKQRFNEGIRLWHTTNAHFDRPTGVTLYMGQLCKYDNVEV